MPEVSDLMAPVDKILKDLEKAGKISSYVLSVLAVPENPEKAGLGKYMYFNISGTAETIAATVHHCMIQVEGNPKTLEHIGLLLLQFRMEHLAAQAAKSSQTSH